MTSPRFFGTDGIRGRVGSGCIQPDFFITLGQAFTRFLSGDQQPKVRILIGRDTRSSGRELETALARGVHQAGGQVSRCGVIPTPALAWLMNQGGYAGAAMITASHNPATDNGIKFFLPPGRKLTVEEEIQFESLREEVPGLIDPEASDWEADVPGDSRIEPSGYLERVVAAFADLRSAAGNLNIVIDCAHGATCALAPQVFSALGINPVWLGNQPDGENINRGVGSEHPEALAEQVIRRGADLGIAFDGDGDRVQFCDREGKVIDGDALLYLLGKEEAKGRSGQKIPLVATVQSNLGLDRSLEPHGVEVVRTPVGDRNVSEAMRERQARWGGESSGHLINSDFQWTGDGLVAALSVLRLWVRANGDWATLLDGLTIYPQEVAKVKVPAKPPLESLPRLVAARREVAEKLHGNGRTLIRYSGTEPVLRLLVEASSLEEAGNCLRILQSAIEEDMTELNLP